MGPSPVHYAPVSGPTRESTLALAPPAALQLLVDDEDEDRYTIGESPITTATEFAH